MNKKEVLEIRKQLKPEKSTISRLCCCYVNHEKEKILESCGRFLTFSEEEQFKYFDLFRHTLAGGMGKNMLTLEYPIDAEGAGTAHDFLMELLHSRLEDEALVGEFFDRVIANYTYGENYLILLTYADYDVPGRSRDNLEMFDASDMVYSYLLCSICPVNLDKPGLSYDPEANELRTRIRDWLVANPANGFLFPAFTDRQTDIHALLYYCAKPEETQPDFVDAVLGSPQPLTAGSQKDVFRELAENALEDACDFEAAKTLQQNLLQLSEAARENPEQAELSKPDVVRLLAECGVPDENLPEVEEGFDRMAGENAVLSLSNIAETAKFRVETPGVKVTVDPACMDLLETRMIGGRPYLVIPVDDRIEVNGIPVRAVLRETAEPLTGEE